MQPAQTYITLADLTHTNSDIRVEVVHGEIITLPPNGLLHQLIANNVRDALSDYAKPRGLGLVFGDGLLFLLDKDEAGIRGARVPDVAYIRKEDFAPDADLDKPYPAAPTLAVEVMSPQDTTEETLARVRDYLDAGTLEVWVVHPRQRELHQYTAANRATVAVYRGDDAIDASALFPDLTLSAAALFVLPDWL